MALGIANKVARSPASTPPEQLYTYIQESRAYLDAGLDNVLETWDIFDVCGCVDNLMHDMVALEDVNRDAKAALQQEQQELQEMADNAAHAALMQALEGVDYDAYAVVEL